MRILTVGFTTAPLFYERVKEIAEARGHVIDFCKKNALIVDAGVDSVVCEADGKDLTDYDLIHFGALSGNRWPWMAVAGYLHREHGCIVLDRRIVELGLDQYSGVAKYILQHEHGIFFPRSVVFKRAEDLKSRLSEFSFPVVVKSNSSKKGRGVGLFHSLKEIDAFSKKILAENPRASLVLREFIPNDGDYRVNVFNGKAITCLKRTPKEGEFRANCSLGGKLSSTEGQDVSEICEIAEKISRLAKYDIAGVDVMVHKETGVPYILEVNRAPGLDADDERVAGVDIAAKIVDLYEQRYRERAQKIALRMTMKMNRPNEDYSSL